MSMSSAITDVYDSLINLLEQTRESMGDSDALLEDVDNLLDELVEKEQELEGYLIQYAKSTPSMVESAVSETKALIASLRRDWDMLQMDRLDFFSDHTDSLERDIEFYTNRKELLLQYVRGVTPQQRR